MGCGKEGSPGSLVVEDRVSVAIVAIVEKIPSQPFLVVPCGITEVSRHLVDDVEQIVLPHFQRDTETKRVGLMNHAGPRTLDRVVEGNRSAAFFSSSSIVSSEAGDGTLPSQYL